MFSELFFFLTVYTTHFKKIEYNMHEKLGWVRESGKSIVIICGLIYAGSTFGILLQHHRKTSTRLLLKLI